MAFNAQWEFEILAQQLGKDTLALLLECKRDFAEMVKNCPVLRLAVSDSGNNFLLLDKDSKEYEPPKGVGLYSIFTQNTIVYFGEANNLYRRQLKDPDSTADSSKIFSNQMRAILKLALSKGWTSDLGLDPMFIQLYPGNYKPSQLAPRTFDDGYKFREYSKALEGAIGLFVSQHHSAMVARAKTDGLLA